VQRLTGCARFSRPPPPLGTARPGSACVQPGSGTRQVGELPTRWFVDGALTPGSLILLTKSAWRPLHLAPPSRAKHPESRKSPATTWRPGAVKLNCSSRTRQDQRRPGPPLQPRWRQASARRDRARRPFASRGSPVGQHAGALCPHETRRGARDPGARATSRAGLNRREPTSEGESRRKVR
jgi:hypothetical protein